MAVSVLPEPFLLGLVAVSDKENSGFYHEPISQPFNNKSLFQKQEHLLAYNASLQCPFIIFYQKKVHRFFIINSINQQK